MGASPRYKVYTESGEYIAACKYGEDAAKLISGSQEGTTIRIGHTRIAWVEGHEIQPAGESYDFVADTLHYREESRDWAGYLGIPSVMTACTESMACGV